MKNETSFPFAVIEINPEQNLQVCQPGDEEKA